MKTGKLTRHFTVDLICPCCGEVQEGPSGALAIEDWEWRSIPDVVVCASCSSSFRKPADPWKKAPARR